MWFYYHSKLRPSDVINAHVSDTTMLNRITNAGLKNKIAVDLSRAF